MKFLRLYAQLGGETLITVVEASSLNKSIYQVANEQRELQYALPPDMRGDVEVFEFPDGTSLAEATLRLREIPPPTQEKRHRDTLYDWALATCEKVAPGAVIQTTRPAPLTADAIQETLTKIAQNPGYKRQRIVCYADDGREVVLAGGIVSFTGGILPE